MAARNNSGKAPVTGARARRRPTSYDVARLASVSQSAVSRCFAPGGSIAPETRDRIMKIAAELGYRPNALAQGLISGRTNLVGVLIPSLTSLYYPDVLAEISQQLTERDIRVLLFSLRSESEVDGVLDEVWRHSVDGVISAARLSDAHIRLFTEHHVPVVLYNRIADGGYAASVGCDSAAGERELVGRLLAAGHKSFAIIAGPQDSYVGEERRSAALARLAEAGIHDVAMVRGDFSYESGREGMLELAKKRLPDAVVCVNDLMAAGAMDAARIDLGAAVPGQMSVVGFDGAGPAGWASYELTSIRQPVRLMAKAAVSLLMDRIEDHSAPTERRLFIGELIPGSSARLE